MVRTLVMTVDRDNDLGVKAGIRGSVVGRRQVLTAALRLGIADPEESDTNAILGALHQHDLLAENAEPNDAVEIAILTGDERVGIKSDRNIAQQLEDVISEFQPDRGVLVTDGMEDESVLPILSSRLSIDHVEKIIGRAGNRTTPMKNVRKVLDGEAPFRDIFPHLEPKAATAGISEGDVVEVRVGAFKGQRARVTNISDTKEEITVELFDAMVPIPLTVRGDQVRVTQRVE